MSSLYPFPFQSVSAPVMCSEVRFITLTRGLLSPWHVPIIAISALGRVTRQLGPAEWAVKLPQSRFQKTP